LKVKKVPMRQCVGCRESREKNKLIRIIKTPEGSVELDSTGKKNGRGAYICSSVECFQKAKKIKSLERALNISIQGEIYEDIERQMLQFVEK